MSGAWAWRMANDGGASSIGAVILDDRAPPMPVDAVDARMGGWRARRRAWPHARCRLAAGGALTDLYPSVVDKASALALGLTMNHRFVNGNTRIAHAAMAVFLMLDLAAGHVSRDALTDWQHSHVCV